MEAGGWWVGRYTTEIGGDERVESRFFSRRDGVVVVEGRICGCSTCVVCSPTLVVGDRSLEIPSLVEYARA